MRKATGVLTLLVLIAWSASANAILINRTLTITGSDFSAFGSDVDPSTESLYDSVSLNFSIRFDTETDLENQTAGLVINSFTLPITDLVYGYDLSSGTLSISSDIAAASSCRAQLFCAFIFGLPDPRSGYLRYGLEVGTSASYIAETVTVDSHDDSVPVPEPGSLALLGLGLAGLGMARRKRNS